MIIPITFDPLGMTVPSMETSSNKVRAVPQGTGVVKRSSSSTAGVVNSGSSRHRSACSGCSISATAELPIRFAVVSCPANMSRKIMAITSSSLSESPPSLASSSPEISPCRATARRCAASRSNTRWSSTGGRHGPQRVVGGAAAQADDEPLHQDVELVAVVILHAEHGRDHRQRQRLAKSATRSTVSPPRARQLLVSASTIRSISPVICCTIRGVKALLTRRRNRAWSGSSL